MSTPPPRSPRIDYAAKVPKRRANSCVPCRESKSRCSGGIPCSTCQRKRQKPRCFYRTIITRTGEDGELFGRSYSEQLQKEGFSSTALQDLAKRLDQADDEGHSSCPNDAFYGCFSLSRIVDEFKLLLPFEGSIQDLVASIQTVPVFRTGFDDEETPMSKGWGNLGQLLRGIGLRTFVVTDATSELTPSLRRLYLKYLSIRRLLDSGKVARAWANFPSIVRDAQLMGLDRDKGLRDSAADGDDTEPRRRIWWLLMDLDAQLSFLLGRQPLISPASTVPKPAVDASRREVKELHHNIMDFSQYLVEALGEMTSDRSEIGTEGERPPLETIPGQINSDQPAKRSTLETYLSRLQRLQSKLPHLPRNGMAEISLWIDIAEHQLEVQLFSMVLNCQLSRWTPPEPAQPIIERYTPSAPELGTPGNLPKPSCKNYLNETLQSGRSIIDTFDYIHSLDPSKSTSSWPRCFGVFCAAVILGMGRLGRKVDLETDSTRIERMLQIFQKLSKRSPGSRMPQMAVKILGDILEGIKVLDGLPGSRTDFCITSAVGETSSVTRPRPKDKVETTDPGPRVLLKRPKTSTYEEDIGAPKRQRYSEIQSGYDTSLPENASPWQTSHEQQYTQHISAFREMPPAPFHESSSQDSFAPPPPSQQQLAFPPGASTSFNASEQLEYTNVGFPSSHPDNSSEIFSVPWWVHPPMMFHPPMYHDGWQGQDLTFTMMNADAAQHTFYSETSTVPVREPHPLDPNIHDGQHIGLSDIGPPPSRGEPVPLSDPKAVQAAGSMQVGVERPRERQDGHFYDDTGECYSSQDHPASSPSLGGDFSHKEGIFGRPAAATRRRSAVDEYQRKGSGWPMDTPPIFTNKMGKGKHKDGIYTPQTPPHGSLLSPVSEDESKSRRHSSTPRQIARPALPASLETRSDVPTQEQQHMSLRSIDEENYTPLRKHSVVHTPEVGMADTTPRGEARVEHARDHAGQHGWRDQPQSQSAFDTTGPVPMPYDMEMTTQGMGYDQDFHRHLPSTKVVTTGPFTGEGHHWWSR
ncbi:uncharacterized protein Z518_02710 [Rhinocladiella mackenziei CBS 650.93]|uniref:Zn(2)-C6 fungal-type domain-containing protein n=1 Tax=Rhinocladiella mackenziei CBS 650.93 TaxID=1442369 RepID=A0A0D2JFL3_9EURO|nr:uncharacterized protein Z518_02710 [Rhinocladiella mackenziei CBS 650.93]KIX08055.1 hypothetical protein Z518_02710 [Rhinocladiella mackenziei CBS 650.93]